jgi:hypothetical protein
MFFDATGVSYQLSKGPELVFIWLTTLASRMREDGAMTQRRSLFGLAIQGDRRATLTHVRLSNLSSPGACCIPRMNLGICHR